MAQAIRQGRSDDGGSTIGAIPRRNAQRLLRSAVPLAGDDAEKRQAPRLEESEEEARGEQVAEVLASSHAGLRDAPAETQRGHEDAWRHLDDEVRREGLPGELRNGGHGADERVLVARQAGVSLEAVRGAVAEDRLVEDLQEVDPDEDDEDDAVRLATDAPAVFLGETDGLVGHGSANVVVFMGLCVGDVAIPVVGMGARRNHLVVRNVELGVLGV